MSLVIAIHQPNYFPWPGFFYKIKCCDKFIILDNVDIQTGNASSLTNRTRIKTAQGVQMLTVPIRKGNSKLIKDIMIDNTQGWRKKHLNSLLLAYKKSKMFDEIYTLIENLISQPYESLSDLNTASISCVCNYININTPLQIASQLAINEADRNLRLVLLCKYLGGDIYLSGMGGKKYNNEDLFRSNGIEIRYTDYIPQPYEQLYGEFIGGLSILDALFNIGDKTDNFLT